MTHMTSHQHKARLAYRSRADQNTSAEDLAVLTAAFYAARLAEQVEAEVAKYDYTPEQIQRIVNILESKAAAGATS